MGPLEAVRAILPKVHCESGVSEMKISKLLFSKGFGSNLVQVTFLWLEIDIKPILGVLAVFRGFIRISQFFSYSSIRGKIMIVLWAVYCFQRSSNGSSTPLYLINVQHVLFFFENFQQDEWFQVLHLLIFEFKLTTKWLKYA